MNAPAHQPAGLYAITRDCEETALLLDEVAAALGGGLRSLQYRNKGTITSRRESQALALRRLTAEHGAALIINDSLELAVKVGADGVHFGRSELVPLGGVERAIDVAHQQCLSVGISCYNDLDLAQVAAMAGADYIAFGAFFPSTTKPLAVRANQTLISEFKHNHDVCVVAIGGITLGNAGPLADAGVDALAVVSGLWDSGNIPWHTREFNRLFGL